MSDDPVSEEDKLLFRQMMGGVKPLNNTKRVNYKAPAPAAKRRQREPIEKQVPDFGLTNTYIDTVNANDILAHGGQNIPSKRYRQLKSGQIPCQGKLDLHGLRPDPARDLLCHFIQQQLLQENRCILIVHGKGGHRGEAPILKNCVNDWLRQLPHVLAFHSALARDGGSGAVYVLLKRQREPK